MLAGITSLVVIAYSVIIGLLLSANVPAPAAAGAPGAYQAGRIAGLFGCGLVGIIGALFEFYAASSLKSFQGKGRVVTAIVFAFIFGALFAFGVVVNLLALGFLPGGFLSVLFFLEVVLRATGCFFNVFAGIRGIMALNNAEVSRAFRQS